jgi:predicted HicB family RNase H-like nuclease
MPPRAAVPPTATKNVQSMVVRLPVELHQEAKQRASDEDMSLAQIIRRALKQYLAQPAG